MLVEILLAASCSIEAAALGVCECTTSQVEGSFEVCATEQITAREELRKNLPTEPKPMRLCSWYANGSIDNPTLSVITAWVPVGSRLCIGDEAPRAIEGLATMKDEVSDSFGAVSRRPSASWIPGGEIEVGVVGSFQVDLSAGEFAGNLLGRSATIAFQPLAAKWQFSDGLTISGFSAQRVFDSIGTYTAVAKVQVLASYRFDGGQWQQSEAEIWLSSNQLAIAVVELPRRTLLISR